MINAKFYPAKGQGLWRVALPDIPKKAPEKSRASWKRTGEALSVYARECSYPFYEWLCIFGDKKPPRAYCDDDGIHFTLFYYGGEWRVFFWPLRGEAAR